MKQQNHDKLVLLQSKIADHSSKVPINLSKKVDTHDFSWFKVKITDLENRNLTKFQFPKGEDIKVDCKTKKVILQPNKQQKDLLFCILESCRTMYNETVDCIKNVYKIENDFIEFNTLRDKLLTKTKQIISDDFYDKTGINLYQHTLNNTIKRCYSAYKGCLTKIDNGQITHFNIRHIKKKKNFQLFDVEPNEPSNFNIWKTLPGTLKNRENFNYRTIRKTSKVIYDKKIDRFTLLVSTNIDPPRPPTRSYISIDPGVRTVFNCLTDNAFIEVAKNVTPVFMKHINKIESYKKKDYLTEKQKDKYISSQRRKLKNKANELHWKTINEFTTFQTVILGNWSTASFKKGSKIHKSVKKVGKALSLSEFKQKLKYKCSVNHVNLIIADEMYTTKVCSNCGEVNTNIGASKVHSCGKCKVQKDRDLNSAKNILLKSLSSPVIDSLQ